MRTEYCIKCKLNKRDLNFMPYDSESETLVCNECKDNEIKACVHCGGNLYQKRISDIYSDEYDSVTACKDCGAHQE